MTNEFCSKLCSQHHSARLQSATVLLGSNVTGRVILLARVILQGNIAEYCPAHDMLSMNEISYIAHEYHIRPDYRTVRLSF